MAYKNAFEALGFEKDDATVFALRAQFAGILRDQVRQKKLTQQEASEWLRVPQGAVSEILSGRIKSKSAEYFIRLLVRAGIPWTAYCAQAPNVSVISQTYHSEATQNVFTELQQANLPAPYVEESIQPAWNFRSSVGVLP